MATPSPPPERNEEWLYMDTLRPPVYVCLRRKPSNRKDSSYTRMMIDGRLDKAEWDHVPWSDAFLDIEGAEKVPTAYPLTRMKMMYDDTYLYIGAELMETKIWGTILKKNSTMYHENDFEVFLNPDGSRHNYYELELNCLNTIWELLLYMPYKDGYSIENPYNLAHLRTAVYVDGVTNSPLSTCTKWCVEIEFALTELAQFDQLRHRIVKPGDVWRMNFSRVQYELDTVLNKETMELQFAKKPDTREANIVWAPTGVIDIHRPEKWGFVFFSSQDELPGGEAELASTMTNFLEEQIAIERVLDAIYYDQRIFFQKNDGYASTLHALYGSSPLPHEDLLKKYNLSRPQIACRSHFQSQGDSNSANTVDGEKKGTSTPRRRSKYLAKLDFSDDQAEDTQTKEKNEENTGFILLSPRTQLIKEKEEQGLFKNFTATVTSTTQQWNIENDGRLWKTQATTAKTQSTPRT